jgi:hypothetical protein
MNPEAECGANASRRQSHGRPTAGRSADSGATGVFSAVARAPGIHADQKDAGWIPVLHTTGVRHTEVKGERHLHPC